MMYHLSNDVCMKLQRAREKKQKTKRETKTKYPQKFFIFMMTNVWNAIFMWKFPTKKKQKKKQKRRIKYTKGDHK